MKLFLLFRLGNDHYALDAAEIAEVLPLTRLKQIPGAPAWVAGMMERRGQPVPVIDLPALATGVPAALRTSTRTVLVHYRRHRDEAPRLLGLRLESATQTMRCPPESFVDGGLAGASPRYLGPVRQDARGLVQWVRVEALLPDEIHAMLFADTSPEAAS
ncbi:MULTISPECIES: chemotaxis protein CheW [Cupriavidus]|uniref:chemotaxis protein CheW n=1 Tax=Cupriavidus sp. DF5525 TaxID=3160989 RepID=UPI0003B04D1D|nr:chemotaxis protein CheW [Ralstonia pickettii DTP0602]